MSPQTPKLRYSADNPQSDKVDSTMTTLGTPDLASLHTAGRVAAAARRAWELSGETVEVMITPVNGHARMASLAALHSRRVEYVVESDDPDVWDLLRSATVAREWQLSALVPLALVGRAHENLGATGFDIQGWWIYENEVSFSGVEIA